MKKDISVYDKMFNVGLFDLTASGSASIITIANFLQEVGMAQGLKIIERGYLKEDTHLGFVLTRLKIRMKRYPGHKEIIRIRTWLSPVTNNYIIRNFELFDDNGKSIGTAVSSSVPFDLKKRKLKTLPDNGRYLIVSEKEPPLPHVFEKLEFIKTPVYSRTLKAGYFDCDIYRHINNTHYLKWALEVLPEDIPAKLFLREVDINFKSEADSTHSIIITAGPGESEDSNEFLHQLIREDTGKQLILMKSIWEPL